MPGQAIPTPPAGGALDGRVVLVTGGAQGIGRGIAEAVLAAGGKVVIGDMDLAAGRECLQDWARPGDAAFFRLDVAREASVARVVRACLTRFGRLDGLVNNAGIADPHAGPLDQLSLKQWNTRLGVSLGGAFLCTKYALPALRQRLALAGGDLAHAAAIVNIASTRAWQSELHTEAYAASKGGLLALTHALAISEGPAVRVNAISPGWIVTDDWRRRAARRRPRLRAIDHAQHPAGRVGAPPDVGGVTVFLLSGQAGFITGEAFVIDGGMRRKMQYAD